MTATPTAADTLRNIVRDSGKPLISIARAAGVSYFPLWKWASGNQKGYDLDSAEKVHFALTGRTFLLDSAGRGKL